MSGPRPKITIVGALPPPVGGVTVFLRRLTDSLESDFEIALLDLRNMDGKKPLFPGHIISPFRNRILAILWLQWRLIIQRQSLVHFNFSDVKALAFVAVLFRCSRITIATLHHGTKAVPRSKLWILRCLAPLIRRKIDVIHALNAEQRFFYQSVLGFAASSVFQCPTHIAPKLHGGAPGPEARRLLKDMRPYVLTSGVGNRLNRADLILQYWKNRPSDDLRLIVSIYGDIDSQYAAELQEMVDDQSNAILVGPMPEVDFNMLLKGAEVYLRPAEVDSFGIAVADALTFGTPVLASDACERISGVDVFSRADYSEMAVKLEALLLGQVDGSSKTHQSDRSKDYHNLYTRLA